MVCSSSNANGGACVTDDFSVDSIFFKPTNGNTKAARFCERFPLIARGGNALALVLCTTEPEMTQEGFDRLAANSHCGGLDLVRIIHVGDQAKDVIEQSSESHKTRVVTTSLEKFARAYTAIT